MKPGIPWSVKGIEPEVREAAKHAARKAGMTLGEWLNTVILDQSDEPGASSEYTGTPAHEDFFEHHTEPPPPPRDDTTIRLEDIAQQLSRLAQRERESATIMPYEPPRTRNQDSETLNRILSRIDSNERQAVEAFTAVNERLSVLGRQIAMAAKPRSFEKPEDVPGFAALETAIRNVVEHIELSDKRTRDGLKSMQDRLAEMSQRANHASTDDLLRTAPAFASLESRMNDLASRLERSERVHQAGLPEMVREEIGQLAARIEAVRENSEALAMQAKSAAAGVAQRELRDIEGRILGLLKDAQAAIGSQSTSAQDIHKLRAEVGSLQQRLDDMGAAAASERDVHALRVAVEQLSTRVAQGPDMRPLADMDLRLGELTRRLEQNQGAGRNLPQFGELERRIAELDHRLAEAVRLQGDGQALSALEHQIGAVSERLERTEQQLGHLDTMERAIRQLYDGLEESRGLASQAAEDAANRAAERVMAAQLVQQTGPSQELQALEDGLRAVRDSAASADQRNQETLEAVHETLEQIVSKLAELETASAGHQLAATMAQQAREPSAAPPPPAAAGFFDPTGAFVGPAFEAQPPTIEPQPVMPDMGHSSPQMPDFGPMAAAPPAQPPPMPDFSAGGTLSPEPADDFIAAARRAAQAAATRGSSATPDVKPVLKAGTNSRFKLSLPFLKGDQKPKPVTYVGGKPVADVTPVAAAGSSNRRKLILAGIVLLAAVSAFTFSMMARSSKPDKQSSAIEMQGPSATQQAAPAVAVDMPPGPARSSPSDDTAGFIADGLITGSLPVQKTDASLAAIVAEPGLGVAVGEMPEPAVGSAALREAASRGDAKAQFIVASRYLDGVGVEQDIRKAAHWYQLAAARGLAPAQYRLATLFERGKGVPQDVAAALLWYERAAEGGNTKAMHNAAVIAAGNQAGAPNYDKAFRWFKAAAERGLKDSQFNLAVLHERGLGAKVDKAEAMFWYTLAGNQGDQDAEKRAAELAAVLSGSEVAAVSGRATAWQPVPTAEDANVVAITDISWSDPDMPVATMSEIATAEPASPVLEAQQLLTRLGFNVGEPDGKMGTRTHNAIRLFQLQSGLQVTGELTPELLEAMRARSG